MSSTPGRPPRSSSGRPEREERRARVRVTAPQRVRVTAPRTAARVAPVSPRREIDEQTGVGEVYLRSLLRAQLRLGLSVLAVVAIALGSLPVLFAAEPGLSAIRVLSVPLPWLLVGAGTYPLLALAAAWHVRAAERLERDFTELVERR